MIFKASNKENVTSLMAILKAKGVYPNDLPTCTAIKQALADKDISDLEQAVDQLLSRVGQDSPVPESEPEQAPTEGNNPTHPVVSATPQPAPKAAGKGFPGLSVGTVLSSFMMLIHGAPGSGKTSLVAKARRVVIADIERGTLKIACARVVINSWSHFQEFVRWFFSADNTEYDTLGADTINALERMCHEHVMNENNWPDLDKPGYGKGFAKANLEFTRLIQLIRNESLKSGKSVIFVGHSKVKSCPNPDGEDFERHCIGLHKDMLDWVYGQMDHVLFAHSKMILKSADEKDRDSKKVAVGQNILQLHTGGAPNIVSKTRCYPPLPKIIPMLPLNANADIIEKFWKQF